MVKLDPILPGSMIRRISGRIAIDLVDLRFALQSGYAWDRVCQHPGRVFRSRWLAIEASPIGPSIPIPTADAGERSR